MRLAAAALLAVVCTSCFTGVESTPKITTDELRKAGSPTGVRENAYLADISGEPPAAWPVGKKFAVTDSRISMIFDPGAPHLAAGETISYAGPVTEITITGDTVTALRFRNSAGAPMTYRTDLSPAALAERAQLEVPFTVETSIVDSVKARLEGNTYYILTPMWYDLSEQSYTGPKFTPVTVTDVMPGNSVYPIKLLLNHRETSTPFVLFMSVGSNLKSPRGFAKLFSFTDPRLRHPTVSDDAWACIVANKVANGMTADECRLAIGAPAKIERRPTRSYLHEIWTYENGIYLLFQDGILIDYRR